MVQGEFRIIVEAGEEGLYYSAVIAWKTGEYTRMDTTFATRDEAKRKAVQEALRLISERI